MKNCSGHNVTVVAFSQNWLPLVTGVINVFIEYFNLFNARRWYLKTETSECWTSCPKYILLFFNGRDSTFIKILLKFLFGVMDGFKKLELVVIFCLELIAFTHASGKCIFWPILIDLIHLKEKNNAIRPEQKGNLF